MEHLLAEGSSNITFFALVDRQRSSFSWWLLPPQAHLVLNIDMVQVKLMASSGTEQDVPRRYAVHGSLRALFIARTHIQEAYIVTLSINRYSLALYDLFGIFFTCSGNYFLN